MTQDDIAAAELGGCPIKVGDAVQISVGAANVGGGVHRCLGSHLARRELRVKLREWHRRIPEYELKAGIVPQYAMGLRHVENLELVWAT